MNEMPNVEQLMDYLPAKYEETCYETKAIVRNRIIKSARELMLLCLIHLLYGCSLLETSKYAILLNIGKLSDVAFMKRFARCEAWFRWITRELRPTALIEYEKPKWLEEYKLVALDATDVVEKGAMKQSWHLHYAIDIHEMNSLQYKITNEKTGESLTNFEIYPDYLVIGDRAYGTKTSIEHCLSGQGEFIFRLKNKAFNLYDEAGKETCLPAGTVNLLKEVEKATEKKAIEVDIYMESTKKKKEFIKLRVCAVKKPLDEIEKSRRRVNKSDSRSGRQTSEESKKMNDYVVVITSLPEHIAKEEILSVYRLRWQVELYFKRLKSIMNFGELPKRNENGIKSWLNGKMMVAMLVEKALGTASLFSPLD